MFRVSIELHWEFDKFLRELLLSQTLPLPPLISLMSTPHQHQTRRDFLRLSGQSLGLAALAGLTPGLFGRPSFLSPDTITDRVLVCIHLAGGNDGLNTVIPFTDDHYHRLRPHLAIAADRVLPLDDAAGLHPACTGLHDLYRADQLAIVQNVGYENPNRSHFGSTRIWATANPTDDTVQTGWLGRYLDVKEPPNNIAAAPAAIHFSTQTPLPLVAKKDHRIAKYDPDTQSLSFASETTVSSTLEELQYQQLLRDARPGSYPSNPFAGNLNTIAQLIASGLGTSVYHLTLSGFDTHSHQSIPHETILRTLSESLTAFQADLRLRRVDHKVLTVAFSEFGRRPSENAAHGTDHGTSSPMFILGSKVQGGLYGTPPNLEIEAFADLTPSTDFRQVYVTLLEDWLHTPAAPVLGGTSAKLPIL